MEINSHSHLHSHSQTHTTNMKQILFFALTLIAMTATAQQVKRPEVMNINNVLDAVPAWLPVSQQAEIRDDLEQQYYLTVAAVRQFDAGLSDDAVYEEAANQTFSVLEGYFNQTETEQSSGTHDGWQYEINVTNPYRYTQVKDFTRNLKLSISKMNEGVGAYTVDYIIRNASYWGVDLKLTKVVK